MQLFRYQFTSICTNRNGGVVNSHWVMKKKKHYSIVDPFDGKVEETNLHLSLV